MLCLGIVDFAQGTETKVLVEVIKGRETSMGRLWC